MPALRMPLMRAGKWCRLTRFPGGLSEFEHTGTVPEGFFMGKAAIRGIMRNPHFPQVLNKLSLNLSYNPPIYQ